MSIATPTITPFAMSQDPLEPEASIDLFSIPFKERFRDPSESLSPMGGTQPHPV